MAWRKRAKGAHGFHALSCRPRTFDKISCDQSLLRRCSISALLRYHHRLTATTALRFRKNGLLPHHRDHGCAKHNAARLGRQASRAAGNPGRYRVRSVGKSRAARSKPGGAGAKTEDIRWGAAITPEATLAVTGRNY